MLNLKKEKENKRKPSTQTWLSRLGELFAALTGVVVPMMLRTCAINSFRQKFRQGSEWKKKQRNNNKSQWRVQFDSWRREPCPLCCICVAYRCQWVTVNETEAAWQARGGDTCAPRGGSAPERSAARASLSLNHGPFSAGNGQSASPLRRSVHCFICNLNLKHGALESHIKGPFW